MRLTNPHLIQRTLTDLAAFLIFASIFLILPSCATIEIHSDPRSEIVPYAGTGHAVHRVSQWWNNYSYDGQVAFAISDVPLCLIADTFLLPYDLFQAAKRTKLAGDTEQ